MMKRKLGNHPDWPRVLAHRYTVARGAGDSGAYVGIIALYSFERVTEPLWKRVAGHPVLLADDGFAWLQFYPADDPFGGARTVSACATTYSVTAMISPAGGMNQWYVDICAGVGLTPEGVPWHDDLYLDLVTAGEGDVELLDADELEEALMAGLVTPERYQAAWDYAHLLTPSVRELTLPEMEALPSALDALRALESGGRAVGYEPLYRSA